MTCNLSKQKSKWLMINRLQVVQLRFLLCSAHILRICTIPLFCFTFLFINDRMYYCLHPPYGFLSSVLWLRTGYYYGLYQTAVFWSDTGNRLFCMIKLSHVFDWFPIFFSGTHTRQTAHYLAWSSHSFFEMVLTPFFVALDIP